MVVGVVRMVSLSNDAYDTLSKLKRGDESFSKVVLRLVEKERKHGSILDFAGAWGTEGGEKETKRIVGQIYAWRQMKTRRYRGW